MFKFLIKKNTIQINLETKKRVVVTGRGVISPIGSSVSDYWEGLCNGVSGVCKITEFDSSGASCQIAGMVTYSCMDAK